MMQATKQTPKEKAKKNIFSFFFEIL